jgi:hypothetical protein
MIQPSDHLPVVWLRPPQQQLFASPGPRSRAIINLNDSGAKRSSYFGLVAQSHFFPQLHSLFSFIGQFLPLFLQLGLSAAKVTVQIAAVRTENRIFV